MAPACWRVLWCCGSSQGCGVLERGLHGALLGCPVFARRLLGLGYLWQVQSCYISGCRWFQSTHAVRTYITTRASPTLCCVYCAYGKPSCRGDFTETPYTHLYHGSSGPALNLTLEGQLLSQWSSGSPHYDALFLQAMPPVDQLLTSLAATGPSLTLLVNQSAVSGLPASLNQATSALLRLMVAAGGAKSTPAPSRGAASAAQGFSFAFADSSGQLSDTGAAGLPPGLSTWSSGSTSSSNMQEGVPRRLRGPSTSTAPDGSGPGSGSNDSSSGTAHSTGSGGGHLPSCMPLITAASSPLPLMDGEKAQRVRQDAGALMLVLCMTLAASVLSASFVAFLVR